MSGRRQSSRDFPGPVSGVFSDDAQESVRAPDALIGFGFAGEMAVEDRYLMLASAPAHRPTPAGLPS